MLMWIRQARARCLEAVAHRFLPKDLGLDGGQITGGDGASQAVGLVGLLDVVVVNGARHL